MDKTRSAQIVVNVLFGTAASEQSREYWAMERGVCRSGGSRDVVADYFAAIPIVTGVLCWPAAEITTGTSEAAEMPVGTTAFT